MKKEFLSLILVFSCVLPSQAQDYSDDVQSPDAVITALYASISGEKGVERDWERFYNLFAPDAKLLPTGKDESGKTSYNAFTPQEYAEMAAPYFLENGFFELEIHRVQDDYGPVTQIFSTYISKRKESDPEPFNRGINSIQLLNDGERWWVMTIFWSHETEENPIPARYLPK